MKKTDPLIRTKLRPPFTRTELVARPRLQEQIARGLRGPLTLITAPAGFGKTTLVASCVAGRGMSVAWLSLDKNDNQARRFMNYLVAALQEVDLLIGSEAAQLVAAAQQAFPETVLTSLINDLDTAGREITLVLDDYQFINSQAVHEKVAFLLEHCPKAFHLVIATRSDPPLPLARLRARGQTVELRTADLRFTQREAQQFLNDVMGLRLDAASIAALEERTEGWIAGLQMAALSMRDREDVHGFIEGFSGTNRYILDYLLDEGRPMQMLLARWLAHAGTSPLRDYAIRLLSQFDAEPQGVTPAQTELFLTSDVRPSTGQALMEPLSQREREVLQLIALGRTNQEVARQLIVAPGTVKAHTASIYRKLDVANRTEAVARARQFGILP